MPAKVLAVVVICLFVCLETCRAADPIAEVEKSLTALNTAFKKGDTKQLESLLAADKLAITPYYGVPYGKEQQIKSLPDFKFTEYSTGPRKLTLISPTVVLVTFPVTMKGTFEGKELGPKYYASSLWALRDGKWQEAFYQETAVDGK